MIVTTRKLLLTGIISYAVLTIAPVTRLVYWPVETEVRNETVTHFRSFPMDALGLPRPRISFVEIVKPLTPGHNGGQVCQDTGGPLKYDKQTGYGAWEIPWAAPCLSDPQGFVWQAQWTWHLGALELGPAQHEKIVLKGGKQ